MWRLASPGEGLRTAGTLITGMRCMGNVVLNFDEGITYTDDDSLKSDRDNYERGLTFSVQAPLDHQGAVGHPQAGDSERLHPLV